MTEKMNSSMSKKIKDLKKLIPLAKTQLDKQTLYNYIESLKKEIYEQRYGTDRLLEKESS